MEARPRTRETLGRDAELTELDAFLEAAGEGLRALSVTGPAGIGKTTVWDEGVRRAESRGLRILRAQPGEPERALSFAGLADLLRDVPDSLLAGLPAVQRQALDAALFRTDATDIVGDQRAAPAAVLSVLERLADDGPLLVAVDDAQWLDEATADALSFALRRLAGAGITVLTSVRSSGDLRPLTFELALRADRRRDVWLGPMSAVVLREIIKTQLRAPLQRSTLVRIAEASNGNPFYALEIARELERVGVPGPGEALPVPGELQALVSSRMGRLPAATTEGLLTAALVSHPTTAIVEVSVLEPAEEAGIVSVGDGGRIRFAHPLLASAVRESATASKRRSVHRRLATLLSDPEERAFHLAMASTGPDETVAQALEEAAARASARGARAAAADLAKRAVKLTADRRSDAAIRRTEAYADSLIYTMADVPESLRVLDRTLAWCPPGHLRAKLLFHRAVLDRDLGTTEDGVRRCEEALANAQDPELAAQIHLQLIYLRQEDADFGTRHCEAILEVVDEERHPGLYAQALFHHAYLRLLLGGGADDAAIARGLEIESIAKERGDRDLSPVPVIWPLLEDDLVAARRTHLARLDWARQVGEFALEMSMAYYLSGIELLSGDLEAAEAWADSLAEMLEQTESNRYMALCLVAKGYVQLHKGHVAEAVSALREAIDKDQVSGRGNEPAVTGFLGQSAFATGNLDAAAKWMLAARRSLDEMRQAEPAQYRFDPDLVEALIGLGRLDEAADEVARLEERAKAFPRPWLLAVSARCRGALLAARGDLEAAAASLDAALRHHAGLDMPYETGRTLLARGQVLRRRKERREARLALQEAIHRFESAGSLLWANRAREELRRVPVRRGAEGLTATEEEVARLLAAGLTVRQVAERAFLSPKTVEGNLARIYLKLGVHSRAELGRAMSEREAVPHLD